MLRVLGFLRGILPQIIIEVPNTKTRHSTTVYSTISVYLGPLYRKHCFLIFRYFGPFGISALEVYVAFGLASQELRANQGPKQNETQTFQYALLVVKEYEICLKGLLKGIYEGFYKGAVL